jgi:hypothetical protein
MKTQAQSGFTIIEVMLFLAVTGMLTIGILVGSSATLGQQRYRDSVNSLKGFIQEQYGHVANVVNSQTKKPICSKTGGKLALGADDIQARGTSECIIMGKLLLVEPTRVTVYDVIGRPEAGVAGDSDTEALQGYLYTTSSAEVEDIDWGAMVVEPKTTDGLTTSILILRSPLSGSIMTYVKDGDNEPTAMINDANMVQKDLCVDSQGFSGIGRRMAVRVNAGASGQSAVEIPLEEDNICD